MVDFLNQEIKFLPGVGPKRAEILSKELKVNTFGDLAYYFPYKYIDRTKIYKISEIHADMPYVQIKGVLRSLKTIGAGGKQRLSGLFSDGSGTIELIWFKGVKWQIKNLTASKTYLVFGKPSVFGGKISIVHPEMETEEDRRLFPAGIFQGYYNTTEAMKKKYLTSKTIHKIQLSLVGMMQGKINETLPYSITGSLKLMALEKALTAIHKPENTIDLKNAIFRLKFEELFFIQLKILTLKHNRKDKFKGFRFENVGYNFNTFYNDYLPFELTNAQKKVIKEIRRDVNGNSQMNRLVQGDVGSGKTLVALMVMLLAIDNGFQSCLMAPTEILAQQHFLSVIKMLDGMGLNVGLLTGSTKAKERKVIHEQLQNGKMQIIIGTHALIEDTVQFNKLGLVVVDEQHRFGVAQRAKLWKKNDLIPPHILVMTATPIPRTLAMTVYGDLDVSVIDELPPGRKPVQTMHYFENRRHQLNNFLRQEIEKGRQAYIVYPLISESEKMDLKNAEEGFRQISEIFPEYEISLMHGKMKPFEKDAAMQAFKKGETQIMVATTVIEVGVDVPNASVMVIESAERFGLSQLHQLRGRVGRGAEQSFCILMSSYKISAESKKRLSTMVRTNDGFEIAEMDMQLRGPGDMEGTKQSGIGFDLKIANLGKDGDILQLARNTANDILDDDPFLQKQENQLLLRNILSSKDTGFDWSSIS